MKKIIMLFALLVSFVLTSYANSLEENIYDVGESGKYIKGINITPTPSPDPNNLAQGSGIGFTSYIRCYFYMDNKLTTLWGRLYDEQTKKYLYAEVIGSWYSEINPFYNMYYTKVDKTQLTKSCQVAFFEAKHNPSEFKLQFINYVAARWSNSYDSEFWLDSPAIVTNKFKRLVVLGDSLSDTHNMFNKMQWLLPNKKGYFHGRFTNGPNWNEYVARYLDINSQIFAEGGAEITPESVQGFATRSLNEQYNYYMNILKNLPVGFENDIANTLFIVFIGGNDFINQTSHGKADVIAIEYLAIIEKLLNSGAKYVMLPVFFDISLAPEVQHKDKQIPGFAATVRNNVILFNQVVNFGLINLRNTYPQVRLLTPNFNDYLQIEKGNFANITEACNPAGYLYVPTVSALCKNPLSYLFWDQLHPTAKAHCNLGYHTNTYLANELGLKYPDPIGDSCDIDFIHG